MVGWKDQNLSTMPTAKLWVCLPRVCDRKHPSIGEHTYTITGWPSLLHVGNGSPKPSTLGKATCELGVESWCCGLASPEMPESADLSISAGIWMGRGGAKILCSHWTRSSSSQCWGDSIAESSLHAVVGENRGMSSCFLGSVARSWTDIAPLAWNHLPSKSESNQWIFVFRIRKIEKVASSKNMNRFSCGVRPEWWQPWLNFTTKNNYERVPNNLCGLTKIGLIKWESHKKFKLLL